MLGFLQSFCHHATLTKHDAADSRRSQKTYFVHHHATMAHVKHCTSKMDGTFLSLALLFVYASPIGFCASACVTCQTFSSLRVITKSQSCSLFFFFSTKLLLRCENYLMVGMLFLNLDSMASKMPLCLAKNRDALLCQQDRVYDRIHYSALLWYLWESWLTATVDMPQTNR